MSQHRGTILILGGTGFVGLNVIEPLISLGFKVFVVGRELSELAEQKGAIVLRGDINNSEFVDDVFSKVKIDIVFHLISSLVPGTPHEKAILEAQKNLTSTMYVLEQMHRHGVKKIIYQSSGGVVYGQNGQGINLESSITEPINVYGWSKLAIEKYIQCVAKIYAINYVILRPSNLYGAYQRVSGSQGLIPIVLGKVFRDESIDVWGDGTVIRDYLHINDFADSVKSIIINDTWNSVYNIGSGAGLSVAEVLDAISDVTGRALRINYKDARPVDIPKNVLNIDKIKHDVLWAPRIDIHEGIRLMWDYVKSTYK